MALLFCDSFDHYATADVPKKYTTMAGYNVGAFGRNGTNGVYFQSGSDGQAFLRKTLPSTYVTLIAGVGFNPSSFGEGSVNAVLAFDDQSTGSDGEQLSVRLYQSDMKLRVLRNGTVLAVGTTVLSMGVYYYIEFKATIDPAAGSYTLRINEVNELTAAGVNTRGFGTNSYADSVRIGAKYGLGFHNGGQVDDFYVCDSSGAVNNDFLGDIRVQACRPNAAGAHSDWTPSTGANFENVDDTTPNDDLDYNAAATAGFIDTYAFTDLVPTTGTVKGVQTVIDVKKDDSGTRTIADVIRQSATDYVGSNKNVGTNYSFITQVHETNPATAAAFTISEVNADEFGVKLVA